MHSTDARLEVEVKFYLADLDAFRRHLLAAGATPVRTRLFERNVRFDNAWDGLQRKGQLLRLRQDDAALLTFKGAAVNSPMSEAKVREELEVNLSDFEVAALILSRVGFEARQVYEKYREIFRLDQVEVVLDELPFGNFVELEGDVAAIRKAADRLGLRWEARILSNYLMLMAQLREKHSLPFHDLTFENFQSLEISIADVLPGHGR